MTKTTLTDAVLRIMGGEDVRVVLSEHAHYVRQLSNVAWDAASEASVTYRDNGLEEARQRGKAHAFCEALGDQSALFSHLDMWKWHDKEEALDDAAPAPFAVGDRVRVRSDATMYPESPDASPSAHVGREGIVVNVYPAGKYPPYDCQVEIGGVLPTSFAWHELEPLDAAS